jgi:hypothetical protein
MKRVRIIHIPYRQSLRASHVIAFAFFARNSLRKQTCMLAKLKKMVGGNVEGKFYTFV